MGKPPAKGASASPPSESDQLAEELERKLGPLIPNAQRKAVLTRIVSVVQSELFSGPIAHPRHLREYEEILPGAAERIVAMAERDLAHSQDLMKIAIEGDIADVREGRWVGFAAFVILIAAASLTGALGNTPLALAFLATGAMGVVGQFIKGRYFNGK